MVSFFFLLFVFIYTYNFTYYGVNTDSRRVLSPTAALMAWTTGNRGLEMHLCLDPSVCFFLSLYLFLLTLTYRLLQQPRTATMSHTAHWPLIDHQQPTTNLHHSPHPVPRRDTGTTTTILPPSHPVNDRSARWVWQRDGDGYCYDLVNFHNVSQVSRPFESFP